MDKVLKSHTRCRSPGIEVKRAWKWSVSSVRDGTGRIGMGGRGIAGWADKIGQTAVLKLQLLRQTLHTSNTADMDIRTILGE